MLEDAIRSACSRCGNLMVKSSRDTDYKCYGCDGQPTIVDPKINNTHIPYPDSTAFDAAVAKIGTVANKQTGVSINGTPLAQTAARPQSPIATTPITKLTTAEAAKAAREILETSGFPKNREIYERLLLVIEALEEIEKGA